MNFDTSSMDAAMGGQRSIASAFNTAGAMGERSHTSASTSQWQDINYQPADGNAAAPEFSSRMGTVRTFQGNQGQFINQAELFDGRNGLMAPASVNNAKLPVHRRHYDFSFGNGGDTTGIYKGISQGTASLPVTSMGSVEFSIVAPGRAPNTTPGTGGGGGFGGGNGGPGAGGPPVPEIPEDCNGCFPVVNTHTGDIMGYKDADETWYEFFSGQSGRLDDYWLPEGEIILGQMESLGWDPNSTALYTLGGF